MRSVQRPYVRRFLERTLPIGAIAVAALVLSCGKDEKSTPPDETPAGFGVPESWGGTWRINFEPVNGSGRFASFTRMAPLCPGDSVVLKLAPLFFVGRPEALIGTGTWGDDEADWECTVQVVDVDCTVPATFTFQASRDGGSLQGTLYIRAFLCEKPGYDVVDDTLAVEGERLSDRTAGCGSLVDPIPLDWHGGWEVVLTERNCTTGEPTGGTETETQTFCAGHSAAALFTEGINPYLLSGVAGGFSDTTLAGFVAYEEVVGSCLEITTVEVEASRRGDIFSGTQRTTTYMHDGPLEACTLPTRCETLDLEGTRTVLDPPGCPAP